MPRSIIVVRNDKLGDFMLAWPAIAQLKRTFPGARILALVPPYTAPMARLSPDIDEVIVDPGKEAGVFALARLLRATQADAVVTLFSTTRVAIAAWLAHIPYRLAPATKLAQFCYNRRLVQRRSRSEKPEWAYNAELAARCCRDFGCEPVAITAPYLRFDPAEMAELRVRFCEEHAINREATLVMIHPGSGGSARNLSLQQYAALARELESDRSLAFMISAGPGEQEAAETLVAELAGCKAVLYTSSAGLAEFARHIACVDLFISGSTGPLHIAGALDVPTAAFYPLRRSATALRWQTTNSQGRHLAFSPPPGLDDMSEIDLHAAAQQIVSQLLAQ